MYLPFFMSRSFYFEETHTDSASLALRLSLSHSMVVSVTPGTQSLFTKTFILKSVLIIDFLLFSQLIDLLWSCRLRFDL